MASCEEKNPRKAIRKFFPFLFKLCPANNYHSILDRYCYCRVDEYYVMRDPKKNWRGGIYDFWTKKEIFKKEDQGRHPEKG